MDYILTINIPLHCDDDDKARQLTISNLKKLMPSSKDGTVSLYEIENERPVRRVVIKNKK